MGYLLAAAVVLILATLGALLVPFARRGGRTEGRDEKDARLYRRQLAELDRDVERGVIRPAEAEGARAEIARRLIGATGRAQAAAGPAPAPRQATRLLAGASLLGLPLLAALIYAAIGSPGAPDLPFAARGIEPTISTAGAPGPAPLTQAQAEALIRESGGAIQSPPVDEQYAALVDQVEQAVAERGADERGLTLLADGYLRIGKPGKAWRTYDELIALKGAEAPAELHARMAEAMVLATRGYVSPQAEEAIAAALAKDPADPVARYYSGMAKAQAGDFDGALATWQALRNEAADDTPWAGTLDRMIAEVKAAQSAPATPGPSQADMEAAAGMSPEERQAMIEGMVASLEARLTSEGGTLDEWLRLMTSYDTLERPADALRAYRAGREALGGDEGAALRQQALVLGIVDQ